MRLKVGDSLGSTDVTRRVRWTGCMDATKVEDEWEKKSLKKKQVAL